jgi:hypothetical protein
VKTNNDCLEKATKGLVALRRKERRAVGISLSQKKVKLHMRVAREPHM